MHKYIDCNKRQDFKAKKTIKSIKKDLQKYRISNMEEDREYFIAEALYEDYKNKLANYESYIEVDMDARMLMELRKSAVIPLDEELYYFYSEHCKCDTVESVKEHRIRFLKNFNEDYEDENWQYYFLITRTLGKKSIEFFFEECYVDAKYSLQTAVDNYIDEFIDGHLKQQK